MSKKLRLQIYNNLNLKTTSELLEVWIENHRFEWSDTAFELIEEILDEREAEIPAQKPAIWIKQDDDKQPWRNSDENSENVAVFYKPNEVLRITNWLEIAAKVALLVTPFQVLFLFFRPLYDFFSTFGTSFGAKTGGIILIFIFSVLPAITSYLLYRAIAYILIILMEFEFNSRGVK